MIGDIPPSGPAGAFACVDAIPKWIAPLMTSIYHDGGLPDSENAFELVNDVLTLYRKMSAEDRERIPHLSDADEVWITCHVPLSKE